ncbi:MAG: hypothetical protein ACO3GP_03200 [Candidatus Limnocylindrus sp.]
MQTVEVVSGLGLLVAALFAAQRHQTQTRWAMTRLIGITALATAGAVLLMMPVRDEIQQQRMTQVGR